MHVNSSKLKTCPSKSVVYVVRKLNKKQENLPEDCPGAGGASRCTTHPSPGTGEAGQSSAAAPARAPSSPLGRSKEGGETGVSRDQNTRFRESRGGARLL